MDSKWGDLMPFEIDEYYKMFPPNPDRVIRLDFAGAARSNKVALSRALHNFDKGASVAAFIAKMRAIKRLKREIRHGSHRRKVAARRVLASFDWCALDARLRRELSSK